MNHHDYEDVPNDVKTEFCSNLERLGDLCENLSDLKEEFALLLKPNDESAPPPIKL